MDSYKKYLLALIGIFTMALSPIAFDGLSADQPRQRNHSDEVAGLRVRVEPRGGRYWRGGGRAYWRNRPYYGPYYRGGYYNPYYRGYYGPEYYDRHYRRGGGVYFRIK